MLSFRKVLRIACVSIFALLILILGGLNVYALPAISAPNLNYRSDPGAWSTNNTKMTTAGDYNGNGTSETAAFYDYGNNNMAIWTFESSTPLALNQIISSGSPISNHLKYNSGPGAWSLAMTKHVVSGDYNQDGYDDIMAMYNYGNNNMGLWIFYSDGTTFTPSLVYQTGPGKWNVNNTKFMVSGDMIGVDDVFVMYDYGNNNMAIFVLDYLESTTLGPNPGSFLPISIYQTGGWNVGSSKFMTASDSDGDFSTDINVVYDYGNNNMGVWNFGYNPPTPALVGYRGFRALDSSPKQNLNLLSANMAYSTGYGNWSLANTKFVTGGDYDMDGYGDIALLYDYGNNMMGLWMFKSVGASYIPQPWYNSGYGNWSVASTKFMTSGFFSGFGAGLSLMYDYGNNTMGIWNFYFSSLIT